MSGHAGARDGPPRGRDPLGASGVLVIDDRGAFNPAVENRPWAEVLATLERRLVAQVRSLSERSPFYRAKFRAAGLDPGDIRGPEDLSKLPFTTKAELRRSQAEHPPLGAHLAVEPDRVVRIHATSGTTGRPTYVALTQRDRAIWAEIGARTYWARGVRPGQTVAHGFGLSFFVGGVPTVEAVQEIGATIVPVGTGASDRLVTAIQNLGVTVLLATPSYAMYLAEYVREKCRVTPASLGIRIISCGAEPGVGIPSIRRKIEEEWGAEAYEGMGTAEVAAVFYGECQAKAGMHFCGQEFILPEVIDPETGEPLPWRDGLEGEAVYSTVDREATPVLRYRTGDRVKIWTSPCACGRTSFRLRCIGRVDDMLILRGVNVFPSAIRDVVARLHPQTTGAIQVVLAVPGPRVDPPLRLRVEYGDAFPGDLASLKRQVEEALRAQLLFKAEVEMVPPRSLPRFEGKTRLTVLEGPS